LGDSQIRRLASRALTAVGWLCIVVAGLQFSVFVGSIAWSFKSGRDVAAHDARVRETEEQITDLEEKNLRKPAGPLAQRPFVDEEVNARRDVRAVQPPQPGKVDPNDLARERLRDELLRLRMSKPSVFTLA